ncbi:MULTISPECIES: sigma-70 family RNA polymerase sigma factor [unclassified Chryseobacterium]|uniref:RNA polymerase sigma factor n=1 Tax=unclassified Chryseobacterium TaxID=2593645 RepID=UPI000F45DFE3|nr:sigma-70 family RNA polymerase sigma factor [Chryseobacterium sp. G0240]ROI05026.1 sigma-70 family RNA polymerase sigma factor [Chryseobacterium sp. G0240]
MSIFHYHNKDNKDNLYESIFYRYYYRIFSFLSKKISNRDDVLDVMQDIFTHLWDKGLLTSENSEAIIFNVTKQKLALFYRRMKKQQYDLDKFAEISDDSSFEEFDERIEHEMAMDKLQQDIELLPELRREILILNKFEGVSQQEIAERYAMSRSAVENQISKAIIFLKKRLPRS